MENVDLNYAKDHLEELIEKAQRGNDVRIVDARLGTVKLLPEIAGVDLFAARVTDTMPPFVPLKEPRKFGGLAGIIPPPPEDFFDPMNEDELKLWYGDN